MDEIYSALTARVVESVRTYKDAHAGIAQPLPAAGVHQIEALAEALAARCSPGDATPNC